MRFVRLLGLLGFKIPQGFLQLGAGGALAHGGEVHGNLRGRGTAIEDVDVRERDRFFRSGFIALQILAVHVHEDGLVLPVGAASPVFAFAIRRGFAEGFEVRIYDHLITRGDLLGKSGGDGEQDNKEE